MINQDRLKELLNYDPDTGLFRWRIARRNGAKPGDEAGCKNGRGYVYIEIDNRSYRAHRLVWLYCFGFIPKEIDHKNCIHSDNRLDNLRMATRKDNMGNCRRQRRSRTRLKGVSLNDDSGKYRAVIRVNGRSMHLGYFPTPEAAHAAYCAAAKKHFGEFARFE